MLGFFGIALPFYLITVAEASTDSALAAVLVSPVPLFVIPMSALFLHDERLTPARILGVVIGLVGVAVLVGFDPASLAKNDFFAELLLVASAVSYAIAGVYAKKYIVGYRPMIPALFEVAYRAGHGRRRGVHLRATVGGADQRRFGAVASRGWACSARASRSSSSSG